MATPYPKPDRSDATPNFSKSAENDVLDVGWAEGVLSDGRPYRLECWCQDQVTSVTIFVSSQGLEQLDQKGVEDFLEREQLVRFPSEKRFANAMPFRDPSGNDMLAINVVVGDDTELYATGGPDLNPYPKADA